MTSQAKIDANRRNGRLSQGPKTDAGKDISRRNALREGFTAQKLLTDSENEAEFRLFLASMVESLQPANADEDELVNGIAICRWRLRRIFRAEASMLDHGYEEEAYQLRSDSLRCLGDRESKILRTMTQLQKQLKDRQDDRRDDGPPMAVTASDSDPGLESKDPASPTAMEKAVPVSKKASPPSTGQNGKTNPPTSPVADAPKPTANDGKVPSTTCITGDLSTSRPAPATVPAASPTAPVAPTAATPTSPRPINQTNFDVPNWNDPPRR